MLDVKTRNLGTPGRTILAAMGIVLCGLFAAIPPVQAQSAVKKTYRSECVVCHAVDGSGTTVGKRLGTHDFRSPEIQKMTDEELIKRTAKGRGKMPAYEKRLTPEEISQLVDYVRELAKPKTAQSSLFGNGGLVPPQVAAIATLAPALLIFLLSLALIVFLFFRPAMTVSRGGKVLAFVGLFALPVASVGIGVSSHLERSKETTFCLSCHTMEPYGQSLLVDDPAYVPAKHFQNHLIPPDHACYICHEDYTMYGGIRAKIRGVRHVYRQYITRPSQPIRLYTAYNNRECLRCHAGARSFEQGGPHAAFRDDLQSNELSCLSSGCHDTIHNVAGLGGVQFWSEPQ